MKSLNSLLKKTESSSNGSTGEEDQSVTRERRNRIILTYAAYAYEFLGESIISDADFDSLSYRIRPEISTVGYWMTRKDVARVKTLDEFWRTEFVPCTGMWIHKHPELIRVKLGYDNLKKLDIKFRI